MAPSDVNNWMRELMSQVKDFQVGAEGDPLTVAGTFVAQGRSDIGGNLNVTGETALTGTLTAAAGIVANVTGNVTGDVSGTASNVTGTVAAANGGTGLTSPGTSGNVLTSDGTDWTSAAIPTQLSFNDLLHVQDQKTSGTNGGTFTSGAWRTRDLNTSITNNISGASLGSNQITLPAGTYLIEASAPARQAGNHKAKLANITDTTDILIGTSEFTSDSNNVANRSFVFGTFTLAGTKVLELQHRCAVNQNTNGLGSASAFSVVEVYADVRIWKVA
jgi:hypothetical protein